MAKVPRARTKRTPKPTPAKRPERAKKAAPRNRAAAKKPAAARTRAPKPPALDPATQRELDEVLALVAVSPKRAATAARKLAQRLGATREAIRIYDSVADACLAADPSWAAAPFSGARDLERELGVPLSIARYAAFAAAGALDERELLDLAARDDSVELVISAVRNGVRATPELVDVLAEAPARVHAVLRGWLEAGLLATLDLDVWIAAENALRELLRAAYELLVPDHPSAQIRVRSASMESIHDFDISGEVGGSVAELALVLGPRT